MLRRRVTVAPVSVTNVLGAEQSGAMRSGAEPWEMKRGLIVGPPDPL